MLVCQTSLAQHCLCRQAVRICMLVRTFIFNPECLISCRPKQVVISPDNVLTIIGEREV